MAPEQNARGPHRMRDPIHSRPPPTHEDTACEGEAMEGTAEGSDAPPQGKAGPVPVDSYCIGADRHEDELFDKIASQIEGVPEAQFTARPDQTPTGDAPPKDAGELQAEDEGDEEALDTTKLSARDATAKRYIDTLNSEGYLELVDMLLAEELQKSNFLNQAASLMVRSAGFEILASTNTRVLTAILKGNLALEVKRNPETAKAVNRMARRMQHQPTIYQNILVDSQGLSPTPTELRAVIVRLREYVGRTDSDFALRVDRVKGRKRVSAEKVKSGRRKYLVLAAHSDVVLRFCENLSRRLDAFPQSQADQPLEAPLVEYGFASNAAVRLQQHKSHNRSNYLMNLTEAVRLLMFKERYAIRQHIVYLVFRKPQCVVAEILFTRLGCGYIEHGGGFSHHPAGQSNSRCYDKEGFRWNLYLEYAWTSSPFKHNAEKDLERVTEATERYNRENVALRAELEVIERESTARRIRDEAEFQRLEAELPGLIEERDALLQEKEALLKELEDRELQELAADHVALLEDLYILKEACRLGEEYRELVDAHNAKIAGGSGEGPG
ncbi:hypothetical protein W97_04304 [Coniosporium apollinis CBS 100218]|uniref:Uncharacterized protein n=1 Tax=Coniosporium apollinis (strain CBS 100218) TaxID=1168221 RepID=R7YTB9_CONA1|nr:uncharacterized protein W97_04304 [Coniosporium apollinis CBS 100218]EON65069.1 hypothetical protein W97_04304 [Coniosporium apollinis CBS 100218]